MASHDGATYPGAYAGTEVIFVLVHGRTDLDGIHYRSRLDSDHFYIALFDCADPAIALLDKGLPIERQWVEDLLTPQGRRIVDL